MSLRRTRRSSGAADGGGRKNHVEVPNSGGETQASFFKREDDYAKNYTSRKRVFVGDNVEFTVANSMHSKFSTTNSTQRTTKSESKRKDTVSASTKKGRPCGECEGCTREDCGKCRFCKDKRKNGGPDKLKKRCSARECVKNISTAGGDGGDATAKMTDNASVQTYDTSTTDSVSSSSSFSPEGLGFALKRKAPSFSSFEKESSSPIPSCTLTSDEPKKKRARPLFKMKLNINMNSVQKEGEAVLKEVSSNAALKETVSTKPAVLEKVSTKTNVRVQSKLEEICAKNISVQQLLSLAKKQALESQSNLTLAQLKEQAREKGRAAKAASVRKQPKRNKKGKYQKASSSEAKDDDDEPEEPMAKIEMHTGFLHLYRGKNPRAKFVWRKY